jgi:hypothetical protein
MSDRNDKRPLRKKGEFSEKKKIQQRQASIYNILNIACTNIMSRNVGGDNTNEIPVKVIIDNKKFTLTNKPLDKKNYLAFIRMKKRGIVLAECSEENSGWIEIILPYSAYLSNARSMLQNSIAAYVSAIEIISETKPNSNSHKRILSAKKELDLSNLAVMLKHNQTLS